MKTSRLLLPWFGTVILALFAGFLLARATYGKAFKDALKLTTPSELAYTSVVFSALRDFHAGDTNAAFETLETYLDSRILVLSDRLELGADQRELGHIRDLLRRVREYRVSHPRKTETRELDNRVAAALAEAAQ